MTHERLAPEAITRIYLTVLHDAIINLRMRIRYADTVNLVEVHDVLDAIHNIPEMICAYRSAGGWFVESHIDPDLEHYDMKWCAGEGESLRQPMTSSLRKAISETNKLPR